jgi:putative addiction module component (TIGR02574 family)
MPKTLSDVTRDAMELPEIERLRLARILLDLSEPAVDSEEELQTAWENEINRRLHELESGQVKGIPLDQVKQRIESSFRS